MLDRLCQLTVNSCQLHNMTRNTIANLETVELELDGEPIIGILMALSVQDPSACDAFVSEVAEAFKSQRMGSPPETQAFLITMIGELSADAFADRWTTLADSDEMLSTFMSQMSIADVVHGTPKGQMLGSVSLLGVA